MAIAVPQQVVRSSSRIPKEIPIFLIGSDLNGKVFSEPTNTVLLSLHGAGIVSHHKLSPEQELILRCPDRNIEAEIRVVGQLGSQQGIYTYGVAFVDPTLKFWDIDFPPMSSAEMERGLLSLVCNSCQALEKIDDTGIEADIFATGDGVLRFCKRCGTTTLWKPAQPHTMTAVSPESLPSAADAQMPLFPGTAPPALSPAPASSVPLASFPPLASSPPPAPASPPAASALPPAPAVSLPPAPVPAAPQASFYASARPLPQTAAPSQSSVDPAGSELVVERLGAVLTLPPPSEPNMPQVNRRKHARVKVSYSACVRHAERGDDIVTCEDMSRGGLRFKSRQRYYDRTLIDVAVPYLPGQPSIFVPAQIVFTQELPEQQLFRYGVAYLQLPKPKPGNHF